MFVGFHPDRDELGADVLGGQVGAGKSAGEQPARMGWGVAAFALLLQMLAELLRVLLRDDLINPAFKTFAFGISKELQSSNYVFFSS